MKAGTGTRIASEIPAEAETPESCTKVAVGPVCTSTGIAETESEIGAETWALDRLHSRAEEKCS